MADNQNEVPVEQKMMENGILILLPDTVKGKVKIKPETINLTDTMRAPKDEFKFKRLVFAYSFDYSSDLKNEEYTLIVHVTHADKLHYNISKLAYWKNVNGEEKWVIPEKVEWKEFTSPNPIWAGFFKATLHIGDPPVALGT